MSSARTSRILRLLFGFYFLYAGTFTAVAPWHRRWVELVVLPSPLALQPILASPYFRGLLLGLGLLQVVFAVWEIETWRREAAAALDERTRAVSKG